MADHGTRASYTAGCRCLPCRCANADYSDEYRKRQRAGRIPLGAKVDPEAAIKLLEQLFRERVKKSDIARALGLRHPMLKVHRSEYQRITVRKHLKIQRLHRRYMSEAAEPEDMGL